MSRYNGYLAIYYYSCDNVQFVSNLWTKCVLVVMFEDGIFMEDGLFTLSGVISQRVRCGSGVREM